MRTRRFELRLLAVALVAAWAAAAGLVLVAYRPGGPFDVAVGLAMVSPIVIALSAVRWPPVARGRGAFPLMVALGTASLLLLLPSIGGILDQILALGSQTLMPSVEAAYPWALALLGTGLFAGFGIARSRYGDAALRRRRFGVGAGLGVVMTMAVGASFAAAAIANEVAIRDGGGAARASRFGPVGGGDLASCTTPVSVGSSARVSMRIEGDVDRRRFGSVDVTGLRAGDEFRWLAYVASGRELGLHGEAWADGRAFVRTPDANWRPTGPTLVANGSLDRWAARTVLGETYLATSEDRGEEVLEGARARRCRVSIDGDVFAAAFPQVRLLIGDADLSRWRGQLDHWVFLDGQLGQLAGSINGDAIDLEPDALQGTITVRLTATERGRSVVIYPPLP